MKTLTPAKDAMIYRQGDPADAVFIIKEGAVEVLRDGIEGPIVLARLERGEIFGETGVIMNEPRSTSMRAAEDCSLLRIERSEFLEVFPDDNPLGLPLLRMLCERLSHADRQMVHSRRKGPEKAELKLVGLVRLQPASEFLERQLGKDGIRIRDLPFLVGAKSGRLPANIEKNRVLKLPVGKDPSLSPEHFAVERREGYLIVRDLGSRLGTRVNGRSLSRYGDEATATLHFGLNEIVAGAADSPFRFRLLVEKAGQD
ncbi:MAG: FHA domain-containing protein [Alphaproteobacteria bacterium]|nr:MAG: FHA domain-containing protein [Alphaproteobacteria bacterium]